MDDERYRRGLATLTALHGHVGTGVMQTLQEFAPDFARLIVECPYGDIYSRGILTAKEREIATIAALVTLGNAPAELKAHLQAGLNAGCTRQELVEILMQMAVYAGFPAALNALMVARELFAELDCRETPS